MVNMQKKNLWLVDSKQQSGNQKARKQVELVDNTAQFSLSRSIESLKMIIIFMNFACTTDGA